MKKSSVLTSLLIVVLLFSCKKTEPIVFSEKLITANNNKLVSINIPFAEGNDHVKTAINTEINKAVLGFNDPDRDALTYKQTEDSLTKFITKFNDDYISFKKEFPDSAQIWESKIDGNVVFQSPEIICLSISNFADTGGAHGNTNVTFLNINPETGKHIPNDKLFKDLEALKTLAKTYFDTAIADKANLLDADEFNLPQNIGFNKDGVILYYNNYEISNYAGKATEILIPAKVISPLLVNSPY